ncbi:hypothetical protein [Gordonia araii]|nr:hypothetical protein [Gordonia araii]NNG96404.1 hypothetical protein [Gordonia araii NBRC 100433]
MAVSLMATLTAMGACALLAAGGIQTLRRRPVGRWLIAAGCGASLLMVVVSGLFVLWATAGAFFVISPLAILSGALTLLFSIVTVVLALVPSTAAWLRSGG